MRRFTKAYLVSMILLFGSLSDTTPVHATGAVSATRVRPGCTGLIYGERVTSAFCDRVKAISREIAVDANHMMAVMAFETGDTFDPTIRNPSSGAIGLIQFTRSTARALGTTTYALAAMTAVEQLEYVRRYFSPRTGKLRSLPDAYMAVLWPKAIGKPNGYVLFRTGTLAYKQNQPLDGNRDGAITKTEASTHVRQRLEKGRSALAQRMIANRGTRSTK